VAVVIALSQDKSHAAILSALASVASRFTLTEFGGERATPAAELARSAPARHLTCEPSAAEAVRGAVLWARREEGVVVVTGSFYLMPEALAALGGEVPRAI
jgi:folylpolyglutamate synthase/dihydropteroate synthase